MNPSSFFALVSRMKYISRWGLMRNAIPENVQEHSHEVAVFAHALGVIRRDVLGTDCDVNALVVIERLHDEGVHVAGGAQHVPPDHAERVGEDGHLVAVLLHVLADRVSHQSPAGDVFHAADQRKKTGWIHGNAPLECNQNILP